jgi:hypothetical protein
MEIGKKFSMNKVAHLLGLVAMLRLFFYLLKAAIHQAIHYHSFAFF